MNTEDSKEALDRRIYDDPAVIEAFEIERTVEVHLASKRVFRVEIVQSEKGHNYWDARYYERKTLYLSADGSIKSEPECLAPPRFYVWLPNTNVPSVLPQDSAEIALSEALNWLTRA